MNLSTLKTRWKKEICELKKGYKKMPEFHKKMIYVIYFLLLFMLFSLPFNFIYQSDISLFEIERLQSEQVSFLLNTIGLETVVLTNGPDPIIKSVNNEFYSLSINRPCTGYISAWAFAALVLALPFVSWKKKLYGVLLGIAATWFLNVLRIFTTVYATYIWGGDIFDFVHTFLWREGLIFIIFGLWVFWIRYFVKNIQFEFQV